MCETYDIFPQKGDYVFLHAVSCNKALNSNLNQQANFIAFSNI